MDSGERRMNPVAMTIINPRKEYWPSRRSTSRPHDYKRFFMLNSAEHEVSMLDKSHLINLLEELLIFRKLYVSVCHIKPFNLISHTLSDIHETLKFEHTLICVRTQAL